MSLVLNTNLDSLVAQNSLSSSGTQLASALSQLSSGLRINSAADDAAGYAIASGLTSQRAATPRSQLRPIRFAIKKTSLPPIVTVTSCVCAVTASSCAGCENCPACRTSAVVAPEQVTSTSDSERRCASTWA